MALVLLISGVVFAAFCIWLIVRIVNRRGRWAKWALAAVIGFPVLYFVSFGPVIWLTDRGIVAKAWAVEIYSPIFAELRPNDVLWSYGEIGCRDPLTMVGLWMHAVKPSTAMLIDLLEALPSDCRATLIPAVSVVFAAFCVWLTVRILNRRERWAKWTLAAVLGIPLLYVASLSPACLMVRRKVIPVRLAAHVYLPLIEGTHHGPLSRWRRILAEYSGTSNLGRFPFTLVDLEYDLICERLELDAR